MNEPSFILSIDQGTTNTKTLIINENGDIITLARYNIRRIHPQPSWVEQDPDDIWKSALVTIKEAIAKSRIHVKQIAGIGIADQGETIILWDKNTGRPVYNAIVWQCRRTEHMIEQLKREFPDLEKKIRRKTGLFLDPYFSATKIKWILENVNKARDKAKRGELIAGTTDTWLIWNLTRGKYHITDYVTASRTMLLNINTLKWDNDLLEIFNIPEDLLPELVPNIGTNAYADPEVVGEKIPITGVIVDQQAALFGHMCFERGSIKATYGTGAFILMNIGSEPVISEKGLLTTIAWVINNQVTYAFDGGVYYAGAVIDWLVENLKVAKSRDELDVLVQSIGDSGGVYFIPAFVGLAAPYWNTHIRAAIIGMNPQTDYRHIARAALEGVALQVYDILEAMRLSSNISPSELKADGGATASSFLMQFQADILGIPVVIPEIQEITGWGAGLLAGLGAGIWGSLQDLRKLYRVKKIYKPLMSEEQRRKLLKGWKEALKLLLCNVF
jgi:glycerol kinase